jgi:hypothetical protein
MVAPLYRDGVKQSGLFGVIICVWERMKDDQEVDIFQTVKQLRYHRPEIIQDIVCSPDFLIFHQFMHSGLHG